MYSLFVFPDLGVTVLPRVLCFFTVSQSGRAKFEVSSPVTVNSGLGNVTRIAKIDLTELVSPSRERMKWDVNPSEKGSPVPLNFANQSTTEGLAAGNGGDPNIPGNARQCSHLPPDQAYLFIPWRSSVVPAKGTAATCPHHGRVKWC